MKRMTSAKEAEDSLQDILLREIKSRANVSTSSGQQEERLPRRM